LAPGYEPKKAPTPYVLIATAYFAYSTQLAAQMAEILDRPEIARQNRALHAKVKAAFQKEFITPDGRITSNEQTAYLLALGFNLVSDELRPAMVTHLEAAVTAKDNHLATGFIGTPMLTPVLTEAGRTDLAYAVLLQETYPGWLFSVKNGATTIWERWDSWTPEIGFNPGGMNSFNHYAYGSVIGWFYDTIAGLKPLASAPGWKAFTINPHPGGGLTHANATLETPYGLAASSWRIVGDRFELDVTIPANTRAHVTLPTNDPAAVTESGLELAELAVLSELNADGGKVSFNLSSGTYQFAISDYPPAP
jgi:alpha-L-rhamnosidase